MKKRNTIEERVKKISAIGASIYCALFAMSIVIVFLVFYNADILVILMIGVVVSFIVNMITTAQVYISSVNYWSILWKESSE